MITIFHNGYSRIIFLFHLYIARGKPYFLFISVASIKGELGDAAFDVKIKPDLSPLPLKVDGFTGALIAKKKYNIIDRNSSMDKIDIKEEPLQDDLVS